MIQMILRRVLAMLPVVLLVSVMVFAMISLVPGDPATTLAGENATEQQIDETRARLGLDDPVIEQYGRWLADAVSGDFGQSLYSTQRVTDAVVQRMPITLSLAAGSMLLSLLIGIPGGIVAAVFRGRWPDRTITLSAAMFLALPSYFVGMLLVLTFAIWLSWLPATSYIAFGEDRLAWLEHLVLPCLTLGLSSSAVIIRQLRSSMLTVLGQDYVRTARAKGLRSGAVIGKHALKNAAIPVVTVIGTQVAFVLGGAVIIEQVFGMSGVGNLAVGAVLSRDLPMIQGVVMMATVVVLICNLAVDVSYGYLNPKVRS